MTEDQLKQKIDAALIAYNEMLDACIEHGVRFDRDNPPGSEWRKSVILAGEPDATFLMTEHNQDQKVYAYTLTRTEVGRHALRNGAAK